MLLHQHEMQEESERAFMHMHARARTHGEECESVGKTNELTTHRSPLTLFIDHDLLGALAKVAERDRPGDGQNPEARRAQPCLGLEPPEGHVSAGEVGMWPWHRGSVGPR